MERHHLSSFALAAIAAISLTSSPLAAQTAEEPFRPGANFLTNWDSDEDGRVTFEELQARRDDLFAGFDENEDGLLGPDEFAILDQTRRDSMQRPDDRGPDGGRAEQSLAFGAADQNGDGSVTPEEFRAATASWMTIMDGDRDGILTEADFGPGARAQRPGQGPGQGRGNGRGQGYAQMQGQGQGQGAGWGQGRGNGGQGRGRGQDWGPGQGWNQGQGWGQGQGWNQDNRQAPGQGWGGPQGGQRGMVPGQPQWRNGPGGRWDDNDQGYGRGPQGSQGRGRSGSASSFEAVPDGESGLWIVDGRTGDILLCRSLADPAAPAGFVPVCREADLGN